MDHRKRVSGMGIVQRFTDLFRMKANKALDQAEDPREVLDYAYQRQLEVLQKVRRGLADVATSRKRVQTQRAQLGQTATRLQGQAEQALAAGREDLAREALTRRGAVLAQERDLQAQSTALQEEEQKLTTASQQLEAKVDDFRTRKETVKASYTAAEARARIDEAATGLSGRADDIGAAIQRAQDRTEQLQARAGALDELMASGALEDPTSPGARDDLGEQLDALTSGGEVEAELAAMKAQLAAGAGSGTASLGPAPADAEPETPDSRDSRESRESAERPESQETPERPEKPDGGTEPHG
jgi:phage shock protein A